MTELITIKHLLMGFTHAYTLKAFLLDVVSNKASPRNARNLLLTLIFGNFFTLEEKILLGPNLACSYVYRTLTCMAGIQTSV